MPGAATRPRRPSLSRGPETGEGRRSEFEDARDIIPVEGLVLIEDLVDRHPVGEILEENLDRNARPPSRCGAGLSYPLIFSTAKMQPLIGASGQQVALCESGNDSSGLPFGEKGVPRRARRVFRGLLRSPKQPKGLEIPPFLK